MGAVKLRQVDVKGENFHIEGGRGRKSWKEDAIRCSHALKLKDENFRTNQRNFFLLNCIVQPWDVTPWRIELVWLGRKFVVFKARHEKMQSGKGWS